MTILNEDQVEQATLSLLKELNYSYIPGPDLAPDGPTPERELYSDVVLTNRLRTAINKLNPNIPPSAREEAVKKVLRSKSNDLLSNNLHFHQLLVNGIDVEYRENDTIRGNKVYLLDTQNPYNNDFLAVNQFTIIENNHNRRPDIILFINGLPLVLIELKNPADEKATLKTGYKQLQTYKAEIPSLFQFNEILITSDGMKAKAGTLTSSWERFMPWKTIDGKTITDDTFQLEVMLRGMLNQEVILDLIKHFIIFEREKEIKKKLAAYHQYHAVNRAVDATIEASQPDGDRKCGVVWHTQGSGKSLIMAFYSGKLVLEMDNPTIVVLTDRNDLDDQLFGTFVKSKDLLRQEPQQADSREKLQELLKVASGGIVFTTIQKFLPEKDTKYPMLSDRTNIVVIADEAHRTQYEFIDGFARHMRDALPNASYIGFTGTPIELGDKNTIQVFGDYIDIYDIEQSVADGATVRIYYENRLIKLDMDEAKKALIDPDFDNITEGEEAEIKEKLKSKWARTEAIVGSEKRIKEMAQDVVDHFTSRLDAQDGKGMIVGMSRRICIDLYNEIIKLKPEWENEDDNKGFLKVVMTGSAADGEDWQKHIRNKQRRKELGETFKDPDSEIKLVIVRDMWLTGFDVPNLHTMYIDKPMQGHGLMQAIARVNRVYPNKEGGLIVDYLGIAAELKKAIHAYTVGGGKGKPAFDQDKAVGLMLEKYDVVKSMFHNFDYNDYFTPDTTKQLRILLRSIDHILGLNDGKNRFLKNVNELSKSFALSVPHERALAIRDEVKFFKAVKAQLMKNDDEEEDPKLSKEEMELAIKQIVSDAITSEGVIPLTGTKGLKGKGIENQDISILSDDFLEEVSAMPQKNLAAELLEKLLKEQIRTRSRKNVVEGRSFAEMLDNALIKYRNRNIDSAEIIQNLIDIAKQIREADERGDNLGLSEYELAFYDALMVNKEAGEVLGDDELKNIAMELVTTIKSNLTIDWTLRENVQAKMRVAVKRILKKHKYPSEETQKAVEIVLEQAKVVCEEWAEAHS
ncbi:MAG: type I restriction endonuclease subunit R [Methanobacteriaceae archaeon]|jgi:type I restriction enzyme R subunit|nr:type I restriction endonuclease subunit R [Methanobacteriaceae archaeon]